MRPLHVVLLSLLLSSCAEVEEPPLAPVEQPVESSILEVEEPIVPTPVVPFEEAPAESPSIDDFDVEILQAAADAAAPDEEQRSIAITLDRPLYRPGETIWARVWDLGASSLEGGEKKAVHVRLLDVHGSVIGSQLLEPKGAGVAAAIELPPKVAGGLYTLAATVGGETTTRPLLVASFEEPRIRKELDLLRDAYGPGDEVVAALEVKRSGAGPLIDHPIKVVVQVEGRSHLVLEARTDTKGEATLRFALPEQISRPDAVLTVVVDEDGWTESISREIPIVLDQIALEWFPEGGDLVTGLPSRVYLRARDAHGEAADVAGVIVDQYGAEVASFRTVHDGLGRFDLTPEADKIYSARVLEPAGIETRAKLPGARGAGCVLRAYDDLDGERPELRMGVRCSWERRVVVAGSLRGQAFESAAVLAGPEAPAVVHLRADNNELFQGVARVTVLSEGLQPIAERLVYRNRHRDLQIDVQPTKTRHSPRDEVVLKVTTRDPNGEPVAADIALSVADDRLLKHADDKNGNLLTQLHLAPWIEGEVEDPAWYFDPEEPDAGLGLDLVMGTHGWRRFARPGPSPDAREGARAKHEEGRPDGQIAENAGVLAALRDAGELDGVFGSAAPDPALLGAVGGLIGVKGGQFGAGGLGTRGSGLGGGGHYDYVRGDGKRERGTGVVGGDPIIVGSLDRSMIDAVIKRHMNQIRYCYVRELTKNPTLGGKVTIKFIISKDGTVSTASVKTTTMNNGSVEQCMVGRFMRMQFPEAHGGGIVIVSYPFLFAPGSDQVGMVGMVGGDPIIIGALDGSLIHRVIGQHLGQIHYCYVRELAENPALAGKIAIKFVIAKDGTVSNATVKSTTMHNGAVEGCMTKQFFRMKFPKPNGNGIVIVSFPFIFSPEFVGAGGGDLVGGPVYDTVREFPKPDYGGQPVPANRTDFRSTVLWAPSMKTDSDGTGEVRFFLDDAVTTFRITAEGVGGGHAGHAESELHSTRSFALDVPLPTEVSFGDRLLMPVRLTSRRDEDLEVTLHTNVTQPLEAEDGTGRQLLALGAGEGLTTVVPIVVPDTIGEAYVSVFARAGGLSDAVRRTLHVAPRGFPHRWAAGGQLDDTALHTVNIEDALPGGTEGQLTLYPNQLASLMSGMASMVRIPSGCFEQTSSSNYPNILVLRHLERTGNEASLRVDRTEALSTGYQRLTSYQVGSGGFETFGNGPGKEALSAYGLLQFSDMQTVFPDVSTDMIAEDVSYLLASRNGDGGYESSGISSHAWGAAPQDITDAFITWSLLETGHLKDGPEAQQSRKLASTTMDPYRLALATLALQHVDTGAAAKAADKLAKLQYNGWFTGAETSVVRSRGEGLLVETASLALIALHRSGTHVGEVLQTADWLVARRRGGWGWGSTQATVLALKALDAVSDGEAPSSGSVRVLIDGESLETLSWTGTETSGVQLDLGSYLSPGSHEIELVQASGKPVPYAMDATWRRSTPENAADAPLTLKTSLAAERVGLGETVRLTATLSNAGEVPSPIARLGLPAGVRVEKWQLEALQDRGEIAFFETRPREVTLYWEGFGPHQRKQIHLDLVAEVPGTFTAPASSAYPYYDVDAKVWAAGEKLHIRP